ncbi:MAG: hypothetical protein ABSF88_00935 [Candidatus Aminicenantales bacterium]
MSKHVPIILFAYARPDHLRQTLDCLRENQVPLIYAFSDGPRTPDKTLAVAQVRDMLRDINWCEVILCERETNLGLGRSILTGVTEVLDKHEATIIFEDDLICVPETYEYLCAALDQYQDDDRVMSVTGWTHPLVTPGDVSVLPYFDGRAECGVWGTWARAWHGMEIDAKTLMEQCKDQGIDIYRYGADLVNMAKAELHQNIWAVRLLYLHILKKGLCLRPPWSMVEHIGWDSQGTNAKEAGIWEALPLKPCPPIPAQWPEPMEHPACSRLHRKVCGARPTVPGRLYRFTRKLASRALRAVFMR